MCPSRQESIQPKPPPGNANPAAPSRPGVPCRHHHIWLCCSRPLRRGAFRHGDPAEAGPWLHLPRLEWWLYPDPPELAFVPTLTPQPA